MSLTDEQKRTSDRIDLGGDALAALVGLGKAKGVIVPQADLDVDAGAGVYEAALAIPAGVVAINLFASEPIYAVVDATAADPALTGAPKPPDALIQLSCVGCTWLHVAMASASTAVLKYEFVYGA